MHGEHRTVVGIFSDITDAKRAADELHSQGILTARLVENELALTFTGTAEREGASRADSNGHDHPKSGGIRGFFARLFGHDNDRASWKSSDSESYFQNAYDKKHHLIIVEDCADPGLCRSIISRLGGVSEEQGSQYYHAEKHLQNSQARSHEDSELSVDADLTSEKEPIIRSYARVDLDEAPDEVHHSSDQAADSGLGVDVDRMPFSHGSHVTVSDRISQSKASGTADHIPFEAAPSLSMDDDLSMDGGQAPAANRDLGTKISVPSDIMSFGGQASGDGPMTHADRKNTWDQGFQDRALNGVSGDADRTPLVGHRAGNRRLDTQIIGDDRIHDRGVSNADVSRLSSDRMMEVEDDDRKLADEDGDIDRIMREDSKDETLDNDHILPNRSYPPSRGHDVVPPAP